MKTSNATTALFEAILIARSNMHAVAKGADNPFFSSKYANYESIIAEVMPCLFTESLVLTLAPGLLEDGVLYVTACITHAPTGQFVSTDMGMPLGKQATPQSAGSAITYASRYLVQALLALPSHDDDGAAATKQAKKVTPHPDYVEWKRKLEFCTNEAELQAWIDPRYNAIKATHHHEELNTIYQAMLDKFRNT